MKTSIRLLLTLLLGCGPVLTSEAQRPISDAAPFRGTAPLTMEGDLAAQIVSGIDRYLDRALDQRVGERRQFWKLDNSSGTAFQKSMLSVSETNRVRLREILGVVDPRDLVQMRFLGDVGANLSAHPAEVGRAAGYRVFAVTWNVFRGVEGEGLLLVPEGEPKADIIAVPDCDWTPEQAIGLAPGVPAEQQFPRRFAEAGCRVLIPALIDRGDRFAGNPGVRSVKHSQRETLWRAGYEMGRTPLGYEVQKILAAADWLDRSRAAGPRTNDWAGTMARIQNPALCRQELGIVGYGEGGLLALYAGALDTRFLAVGVCGAFGLGHRNAEQPVYRNVWSLLERFGDAELAAMILPRAVVIEHGKHPEVQHPDQHGGAPGRLWRPSTQEVEAERQRLNLIVPELAAQFLNPAGETVCDGGTAQRILGKLSSSGSIGSELGGPPMPVGSLGDSAARTRRQYTQLLEDTQHLMRESEYTRREFWKKTDRANAEKFTASAEWFRDHFRNQTAGMIPKASMPPNPRSRFLYETNGYRGYEVVLDVHPDVIAYGILLVPADIKPGEKRPVVVCQHGLEGRPRDVADPNVENPAYHRYACRLAERGFVTFSP